MSANYGHLNAGEGGKNKSKKVKIMLDNWCPGRYNTQAVWWTASKTGRTAHKSQKRPEKRWKNILTNGLQCDRMSKFATERNTVPCKLNNAKTNKTPLTNLWICLKRKRKQPTKILELIARSKWFRKWFEAWKRFRYNFLRVWSWLRTNAGGVPNTCKSNGVSPSGLT